jgi:hypothetical protein
MKANASKANLRPNIRNPYFPQLDHPTGQAATTNPKNKKAPLKGLWGEIEKAGPITLLFQF